MTHVDDVSEALSQFLHEQKLKPLDGQTIHLGQRLGDASSRFYYRLEGSYRPLLLMVSPSKQEKLAEFIQISTWLRNQDLRAPEIITADIQKGFAIIEDFGSASLTQLLNQGENALPLYEAALEALIHLQRLDLPNFFLPSYHKQEFLRETEIFIDYYWPYLAELYPIMPKPYAEGKESWRKLWSDLYDSRTADRPKCLVLRDFHVDNLIMPPYTPNLDLHWKGRGIGLLDFQDALIGSPVYDVISLLEDARRSLDTQIHDHLWQIFLRHNSQFQPEFWREEAIIWAVQRHIKVLGIFVRLSVRDNKPNYLQYLPHVNQLLFAHIKHNLFTDLKAWLKDNKFIHIFTLGDN